MRVRLTWRAFNRQCVAIFNDKRAALDWARRVNVIGEITDIKGDKR